MLCRSDKSAIAGGAPLLRCASGEVFGEFAASEKLDQKAKKRRRVNIVQLPKMTSPKGEAKPVRIGGILMKKATKCRVKNCEPDEWGESFWENKWEKLYKIDAQKQKRLK